MLHNYSQIIHVKWCRFGKKHPYNPHVYGQVAYTYKLFSKRNKSNSFFFKISWSPLQQSIESHRPKASVSIIVGSSTETTSGSTRPPVIDSLSGTTDDYRDWSFRSKRVNAKAYWPLALHTCCEAGIIIPIHKYTHHTISHRLYTIMVDAAVSKVWH